MSGKRLHWQVPDDRLTEIIRGPASEAGAMATELRDLRSARSAERMHDIVHAALNEFLGHYLNCRRAFDASQDAIAIANRVVAQLTGANR